MANALQGRASGTPPAHAREETVLVAPTECTLTLVSFTVKWMSSVLLDAMVVPRTVCRLHRLQ